MTFTYPSHTTKGCVPLSSDVSEDAWKLWLEGQLFETSGKLHVTKFEEMQCFINEQLSASKQLEGADYNA